MTERPPTIYVVDRDARSLRMLRALLESVQISVETYLTPGEFLPRRGGPHPGCLILGTRLPLRSGLALQRRLRQRGDALPVIFLTGDCNLQTAVTAMREGAFDLLQAPVPDRSLLRCVHAALARDRRNRQKAIEQEAAIASFQSLSPAERAVLDLVMKGRRNQDTARELGVTHRTVNTRLTHIVHKMTVPTIVRLAGFYRTRERPVQLRRSGA